MSLLCHPNIIFCHSYINRMSSYVILYLGVCHLHVARVSLVCHLYVLLYHLYTIHMYLYVIRMTVLYTCMSPVCIFLPFKLSIFMRSFNSVSSWSSSWRYSVNQLIKDLVTSLKKKRCFFPCPVLKINKSALEKTDLIVSIVRDLILHVKYILRLPRRKNCIFSLGGGAFFSCIFDEMFNYVS